MVYSDEIKIQPLKSQENSLYLNYSFSIWLQCHNMRSIYKNKDNDFIESVQRCAARFVKNDYNKKTKDNNAPLPRIPPPWQTEGETCDSYYSSKLSTTW